MVYIYVRCFGYVIMRCIYFINLKWNVKMKTLNLIGSVSQNSPRNRKSLNNTERWISGLGECLAKYWERYFPIATALDYASTTAWTQHQDLVQNSRQATFKLLNQRTLNLILLLAIKFPNLKSSSPGGTILTTHFKSWPACLNLNK